MSDCSETEVDSGSTVGGHLELIGEFRRRFPLFDRIAGRFGEDTPTERIPWFFAFILSAAAKPGPGACCFVLDRTSGTTAIAAVLAALARLQKDFRRLVERYARIELPRGQRVKVRPTDFVYEYEGPWDDCPDLFRLKLLGENAWRSFPLVDVLRLEPTDHMRTKGKGNSDLGAFERSPLDKLLDLTTCGNNSIIRNTVLAQMARAHFARVAEAVILMPGETERFAPLSRFLPWGSIGPDGTLRSNDQYQVIGEPLLAVTSFPEDLARACSAADRATRIVLVDGARRLAQHLQAFDDIAERQRLVILASADEAEEIDLLKDRGCAIWHMSAGEVLIGEASAGTRSRASLVGATIRAADMRRRAKVTIVDCRDEVLEAAAAALEQVTELIADKDDVREVDDALLPLFRILFECSECCFGAGEGTASDLRAAREHVAQNAMWLEPGIVEKLREAIDALERAAANEAGREKVDKFRSILTENDGQWAIAARSPRTAERLREDLDARESGLPILLISTISPKHEYGRIIVPAWPNGRKFAHLKNLSVTPEIYVLAYPFERKWVFHYQARERARRQSNRMEAESRSSILGIEPRFLSGMDDPESEADPAPEKEVPLDLPVFRFEARVAKRRAMQPPVAAAGEDSREAQFVRFFGGCYALLTEWAALPVLNELIDNSKGDKARLLRATASRLSTGDFVLFRAGGNKELVRLIAEALLGTEEYRQIRGVAERWKSALRRLGSGPATVQRRLADHGLDRTPATVAGWLYDPDRIGPGDSHDIEAIARAAEDSELLSTKDEVREAIRQIRGAHLNAGKRLTKLILGKLDGRLGELDDQPTLLDLDFGQAWVVQVESVEARRQAYPANQVNRLLWADDSAL